MVLDYQYPWANLIRNAKFHRNLLVIDALAELMAQDKQLRDAAANADWIVPVPMSVTGLAMRGFNAAQRLAAGLAPANKIKLDVVIKGADNATAQHLQNRTARLQVRQGTYFKNPDEKKVAQTALIVDDVMTTGSTLIAVAKALRPMAETIIVCALARVPEP